MKTIYYSFLIGTTVFFLLRELKTSIDQNKEISPTIVIHMINMILITMLYGGK